MSESRTKNATLNIISKLLVSVTLMFLRLWSRTVFFNSLGDDILGLSSLFQDVLTILSFSDLGFQSVLMVTLYKPIEDNDVEKIHSLLELSRKVYRYVILAITVFGIALIPLFFFVKTGVDYKTLVFYYSLYLINNVCSYFYAYKETYLQALQKQYKLFYINFAMSVLSIVVRTLVLQVTLNYTLYLVLNIVFTVTQKYLYIRKIDRLCPEVQYDHAEPVDKETKDSIFRKAKAMLVQKISTLGINQTDSFIVSVAMNSAAWGVVSNYNLLKSAISSILTNIVYAIIPSMGSLMNSSSKEYQLSVFLQYDFLNCWLYTFVFAEALVLFNPLISMMFSQKMVMTTTQLFIYLLSLYLQGMLEPINVMRESSGMFERDQWVGIVACITNLITSVLFINMFGLPGVFLGTIISSLMIQVFRTSIFFDHYHEKKYKFLYFRTYLMNVVKCLIAVAITFFAYNYFIGKIGSGLLGLFIKGFLVAIVCNGVYLLMNINNPSLKNLVIRARKILHI